MLNCARAENDISKKLVPWVASCGHVGKNEQAQEVNLNGNDSISVACASYLTCTINSYVRTTTHTRAIISRCLSLLASRTPSAGLLKL